MVERGADINEARDNGVTPLSIASEKGHVEVARILVDGGADINKAANDGQTPLYAATSNNHTEIIHMLELAAQV